MTKYLFCDLDNTLLFNLPNGQYGIKENDLNALKFSLNQDLKLVITSGRYAGVKKLISSIIGKDIDAIGFNGHHLITSKGEVLIDYIPINDYIIITEDIGNKYSNINCATIDFNGTYFINNVYNDQPLQRFTNHQKAGVVDKICHINALDYFRVHSIDKVSKILVYVADCPDKDNILNYLNEKYGNQYDFIFSSDLFIEGLRKNVSKKTGIEKYIELFQIDAENCYVVGDSDNDIEMLSMFPERSFCMKHGSVNAQKASNFIVEDISEVLRRLL